MLVSTPSVLGHPQFLEAFPSGIFRCIWHYYIQQSFRLCKVYSIQSLTFFRLASYRVEGSFPIDLMFVESVCQRTRQKCRIAFNCGIGFFARCLSSLCYRPHVFNPSLIILIAAEIRDKMVRLRSFTSASIYVSPLTFFLLPLHRAGTLHSLRD